MDLGVSQISMVDCRTGRGTKGEPGSLLPVWKDLSDGGELDFFVLDEKSSLTHSQVSLFLVLAVGKAV